MATVEFDLLCAFETHAADEIRAILDRGFDVRSMLKGRPVVNHLLEMYARSADPPAPRRCCSMMPIA